MENTFEVKETTTTIKKYNAADLPLYFKWTNGSSNWYFRVRNRDGKIISDLIKNVNEGYEFTYSTVQSAFDKTNEKCEEIEWRNEMHKFINQIN
jgi:hypothetical protein|tara:strand:- start:2623 stop:2904 length:282 start_codon:yes stop_codon:yes gene_type:complete